MRCGKVGTVRMLTGARHCAGLACVQDSVEHALLVSGWHRARTLSRSLKCRGYDVRYVPRWYYPTAADNVLRAPFAYHAQLWKQLDAEVPPSPPFTQRVEEAIDALKRRAALETLKGLG